MTEEARRRAKPRFGLPTMMRVAYVVGLALALMGPPAGPVAAQPASWLDGALEPWNVAGQPVPRSALQTTFAPTQCLRQERPAVNAEETQVLMAGWKLLTTWPTQRRGDVAVVMATSDHDGMCRPIGFNGFVFTGGRFAGTIAPEPMGSRADGTLVRPPAFLPDGRLDASFVRYAPSDPLCCPSRPQTRLWYRVDATAAGPVLIAERPSIAAGLRMPATGSGPGDRGATDRSVGACSTLEDECSSD